MIDLARSLGNIGSEFGRAHYWKNKNETRLMTASMDRALELLDSLQHQPLLIATRRELLRLRELMIDDLLQTNHYPNSSIPLNTYFIQFGIRSLSQRR